MTRRPLPHGWWVPVGILLSPFAWAAIWWVLT